MADPNQTPQRGDWACPCNGCSKAVKWERKQLLKTLEYLKDKYLNERGSAFDDEGNLLWAKEDAITYAYGIDVAINLIKDRDDKKIR